MTAASPQPATQRHPSALLWIAGVVLCTAVIPLALQLEILVDDAFITFRYVSNARDGHGLVWNPPPFLPVEGYTSFAWAMLLWAVWAWSGIEPPQAANVLSIGCGTALLLVCTVVLARLRDRSGQRCSAVVGVCALLCIAGNRTFLQWLTGGLETALFQLVFVSWVALAFRAAASRTVGWWMLWSSAAAATALTRPDGLLLVAATAGTAAISAALRRCRPRTVLLGLCPLLLVVTHVGWRRIFYGEWLPNTYFAKVSEPWPESGLRFFACFALENGVWLWVPLAMIWLAIELIRPSGARTWLRDHLPACAATAATALHVAYYVVRVGGDHFEYRVLSHLVPLGVLAAAAMLARIGAAGARATVVMLALGAASTASWYQHTVTEFRAPPGYDALAPHTPAWARPLARYYDRHRLWLQLHLVGIRFLHGLDLADTALLFPERKRRADGGDDLPVMRASAVGWVGWVLPDFAVIDELGLNDWVTARSPVVAWGEIVFPKVLRDALLTGADDDGDGAVSRAELVEAQKRLLGRPDAEAQGFADMALTLFAHGNDDRLTASELAQLEYFYANLRLMAHDHRAPDEYLAAFDPNVSFVGREAVVRPRGKPLRAADIRAAEALWRQRVRGGR